MRILLAHNSPYYPSAGGGDKSNRLLMKALAARGHVVRVVARAATFGAEPHEALLRDLAARGVTTNVTHHSIAFKLDGAAVEVFSRGNSLKRWAAARMHEYRPDVILASTDDPAQLMLDSALRMENTRVVYLIRAMIALPFGPVAGVPSDGKTAALRHVDGSAAVSESVARYAREWGGLECVHLPISLPDRAEYPDLGRFENRFVTMINPCAGKGLSILLGLAERFPNVPFAAVPTWGTTPADLEALRRFSNITILEQADDVDRIFEQTRVALVPSLWAEARSRVILEALARGIPVLASDVGGSAEAMLGLDYLLPVNPIAQYRPAFDELMVPSVEVPEQDLAPWVRALERLVGDRGHYEQLSRRSREAAMAHARTLSVAPFEAWLAQIVEAPPRPREGFGRASRLNALSPEKGRLLAIRVKQNRKANTE